MDTELGPGAAPDATPDATPEARTGLGRVGAGLTLATMAWVVPFAAASAVLLPQRIAEIAPDGKVSLLAVLHGAAAVMALVANVVFGALSDVTRSRFGARTPWIVGGTVVTAALFVPLSGADTFGVLLFWWCLVCAAQNAAVAAIAAILPDRVPVPRRATISAVVGVALLLGNAIGAIAGAAFLDDVTSGLLLVAAVSVVLAVAAVLVAPDRPSTDSGSRFDLRVSARAFRPPRRAPDFYWALWGRLLLVVGYFMIYGFQLYILTDYVGLDDGETARAIGVNSVLFLGTALVGAVVAGPLSDRLARRKVFVIAACVLATIAIAFPLASADLAGMAGFATVGGLAFGIYFAVDAALMSEVLPSQESRARDLGFLNVANTGGQVLAPAASSLLVGIGAGYLPVFVAAIALCAVGAAFVPPIRSVR